MARRADPARIEVARRDATRARLMGDRMTEETADACLAAWEAEAARDGLERGAESWDRGWRWIAEQRELRARPRSGARLADMHKSPRYHVVAIWILGGRYDADGWLEIRTHRPDLRTWEARCRAVGWDHRELTGSMPIAVRVELEAGASLGGRAYVDQARHLWGWKQDEADLKVHGTESRFDFRERRADVRRPDSGSA